jgi:hypothetical protein
MKKPPSRITTALMSGVLTSFFILIPCFNCIIMIFSGAIAVEWHIQRSDKPVSHLDAFVISLVSCLPPLLIWLFYWFYLVGDDHIGYRVLNLPLFAFISTLSGLMMASASDYNRALKRKQEQRHALLLESPQAERFNSFSANAKNNLRETINYRQEIKSREPVKQKVFIKNQTLPTRCEICHQSDQFDPATNHCARCAVIE